MKDFPCFIILVLVAMAIQWSCTSETQSTESKLIEAINLTPYQLRALNTYNISRGINIYDQLELDRYFLPRIKSGKIIVSKEFERGLDVYNTLVFKDSLLMGYGSGGRTQIVYDSLGHMLKNKALSVSYTNGKIARATNGPNDWKYTHQDSCVLINITEKNSDYQAQETYCYDDQDRLLSLDAHRISDGILEQFRYQYQDGHLVGKTYYELQGQDTISFTISKVDQIENGLIRSYTEDVKYKTVRAFQKFQYDFEVLSTDPLTIKKNVIYNGELKYEYRYVFNERNHIIEYYTIGKYGDKYFMEYEYGD